MDFLSKFKKRDPADVEKALAVDMATLQPAQFAEFDASLQVMLMIRIIQEGITRPELFNNMHAALRSALHQSAQKFIFANEAAFYSNAPKRHLADILKQREWLNLAMSGQVNQRVFEVTETFGNAEATRILLNDCQVGKFIKAANDKDYRYGMLMDDDHFITMQSPEPTDVTKGLLYGKEISRIPVQFCERTKELFRTRELSLGR